MPETPNHGYNVPSEGAQDWHKPLNENFEEYDTDIEIRDTEGNLGDYTPKAGAKFLATDTERVYLGDGSNWVRVESAGPSPLLTGLGVGGSGRGIAHVRTESKAPAVSAQSSASGDGPAVEAVNFSSQGDAIEAISQGGGRSALMASVDSEDTYGVLSYGGLAVGFEGDEPSLEVNQYGIIQCDPTPDASGVGTMLRLYRDGTGNLDRRVFSHSEEFSDWGLVYLDTTDEVVFQAGGDPVLTVDLELNGRGGVEVNGDLDVSGNKNFVQTVDTDGGERDVVYTATESGTPRTEVSGLAELEDGRAAVDLPEHFGWVTSDAESLVVQTTPYGGDRGLKVVERSTDHIVVEDLAGEGDYEFAYTVRGTREGHADKQVVRESTMETPTPGSGPAPADD